MQHTYFFALTFEARLVVDRKLSIEIFKINYRFAKGTTEVVDFEILEVFNGRLISLSQLCIICILLHACWF